MLVNLPLIADHSVVRSLKVQVGHGNNHVAINVPVGVGRGALAEIRGSERKVQNVNHSVAIGIARANDRVHPREEHRIESQDSSDNPHVGNSLAPAYHNPTQKINTGDRPWERTS